MPAPISRTALLAAALLIYPLPSAALEALEKDGHWAHSVNDAVGAPVVIDGKMAGSGSRLANVEAGLPCTQHVLLRHLNSGNLFAGPGADKPVESHPTAVSSVLVGRAPDGDARFSGLAPGADFRAGTFAVKGDAAANPFTMRSLLGAFEQAFTWADVVNTSWGSVTPPGTYEFYSDLMDALCSEHPTCLFVVAAGNTQAERWGASRGKVSQIASGFNNLSVGALGNAPPLTDSPPTAPACPFKSFCPTGAPQARARESTSAPRANTSDVPSARPDRTTNMTAFCAPPAPASQPPSLPEQPPCCTEGPETSACPLKSTTHAS